MKYNPNAPTRCTQYYTVSYMLLKKDKVQLCVGKVGLEAIVASTTDGDGRVFESIDSAKRFAMSKGYIEHYEEREENKKTLNKNKTSIV